MSHKSFPKIRTDCHVIQRTDLDYGFWFSPNIEDWISSHRRRENKRVQEYYKSKKNKQNETAI